MKINVMKVVLCTPEFYPINGGVSNAIQNFAKLLVRNGYKVHIVTPLISNLEKYETWFRLKIRRIKPLFGLNPYKTFGKFIYALQAAIYIRSLKPDLVIGETIGILGGFISGLVNNKKIKAFARGHGSELHGYFMNYRGFRKIFFNIMLYMNDLILVTNKNHYEEIRQMNKKVKVRYLYNYIPLKTKKKSNSLNSEIRLLSVSRLIRIKGIQYCLLALAKTNIAYIYTIVGEGEYRKELEKIVKEKNIDNVIFKGKLPNDEVENLMQNSDLLVFLSTREGLSMTMLEALSVGLSILATNVGGAKHFIKHDISGYKVDRKSVDDVINALNNISKNREILLKYSENSIKIFKKYFGEKAIIQHFNALYQDE